MPDEYMLAEEAAAYIKVHVETLRKWVRLGVFPYIPLPGTGKDYRLKGVISAPLVVKNFKRNKKSEAPPFPLSVEEAERLLNAAEPFQSVRWKSPIGATR